MGLDSGYVIMVGDADFIPSVPDLVKVAAALEKAGVIDAAGREDLEQQIKDIYTHDDGTIDFDEYRPNEVITLEYVLANPSRFDVFNGEWHPDGPLTTQSLEVYTPDHAFNDPMAGEDLSRFVIARIDFERWGNQELFDRCDAAEFKNPQIRGIIKHVSKALGVDVMFYNYVY